jgi:hypothetical protein
MNGTAMSYRHCVVSTGIGDVPMYIREMLDRDDPDRGFYATPTQLVVGMACIGNTEDRSQFLFWYHPEHEQHVLKGYDSCGPLLVSSEMAVQLQKGAEAAGVWWLL